MFSRYILTLLMSIRKTYFDECSKFFTVNKCTKIKKEKKKESGIGFVLAP